MQSDLNFSDCTNIVFLCSSQAHLVDGRASAGASVDSARQNLAATFVNGFVNAGFGVVCSWVDVCLVPRTSRTGVFDVQLPLSQMPLSHNAYHVLYAHHALWS
jgi:hypothetical protein